MKKIIGFSLLTILIIAVGAAYGAYSSWLGSGRLATGLIVQGEPVGDLKRDEARRRLQRRFGRLFITVQTPQRPYKLSLKELGGQPQIDRIVQDLYWYGRRGNIFDNLWQLYTARGSEQRFALRIKWNKAQLRRKMWAVATNYRREPRNANLEVSGAGVQVLPHREGRAMNVGDTLQKLQRRYYAGLPEVEATVKRMAPRIAASDLAGTDVKLGEYRTYFDSGLRGRTKNIRLASQALYGKVLMPGQTFSFNDATGERTPAKGYRIAHIFVRKPGQAEAEVVDGVGGGVCQVSSTLFNAVRKSNRRTGRRLKITERNNHSLPVTYVPSGLDATVAWPYRDFKFRNTFDYPVYLRTAVNGSRLAISVWGRVPYGTQDITLPVQAERHAHNF